MYIGHSFDWFAVVMGRKAADNFIDSPAVDNFVADSFAVSNFVDILADILADSLDDSFVVESSVGNFDWNFGNLDWSFDNFDGEASSDYFAYSADLEKFNFVEDNSFVVLADYIKIVVVEDRIVLGHIDSEQIVVDFLEFVQIVVGIVVAVYSLEHKSFVVHNIGFVTAIAEGFDYTFCMHDGMRRIRLNSEFSWVQEVHWHFK